MNNYAENTMVILSFAYINTNDNNDINAILNINKNIVNLIFFIIILLFILYIYIYIYIYIHINSCMHLAIHSLIQNGNAENQINKSI